MLGDKALADAYLPDFGVPFWNLEHDEPHTWPLEAGRRILATWQTVEEIYGLQGVRWLQPTEEYLKELDADTIHRVNAAQVEMERRALLDPIGWGFTLRQWRDVMYGWKDYTTQVVLGGNRSSKSTLMARMVVSLALKIPGFQCVCWAPNEEFSIKLQQRAIWDALPYYLKESRKKKGQNFSLQWTQRTGFTGGSLILPPVQGAIAGSEITFKTYSSFQANPLVAQGFWAHLVWMDEEAPLQLFEEMFPRVSDVRGRIFLTFTTAQGWTPLVEDLIGKARTTKVRHSDLVGRNLPVEQVCTNRDRARIVYFWTQDNPFIETQEFLQGLMKRPIEERLAKAHGIPTNATGTKFPLFDEQVHVIPHEELPWVKERRTADGKIIPPQRVTRYMVIDPAGSKNWFMLWVAVSADGTYYVYREWPDVGMGDWADASGDPKGKAGSAQRGLGYGIQDYIEVIEQAEDTEDIFERYIDPRAGATERQTKDGATTIISELEDCGMVVQPAPGLNIEHGLQLINNKLAWDQERPMGPANRPRLLISDRCSNLIFAMKNFTACHKDEACKDPVDCLRYLLEADICFVDPQQAPSRAWGGY